MLYRRSLRSEFLIKLTIAMAILVFITSSSLYIYIRLSNNYELESNLYKNASFLLKDYDKLPDILKNKRDYLKNRLNIEAKIGHVGNSHYQPNYFKIVKKDKKYFLKGFFPYNFKNQTYLILSQDITRQILLEQKLYKAVVFINIISLIVIIIYAFIISTMLTKPIKFVSKKIIEMSESSLKKIDTEKLPLEFEPLGKSINNLINKIENYIYYQKELFIGAAHELKTPLAVMKIKSQVALIKKNTTNQNLKDAINQNIESINTLNNTIESILAYGRSEGAQFDKKIDIDIVEFLNIIIQEHEIMAIKEDKFIIKDFKLRTLTINIQPSLFRVIIQNLLQNALRFTPNKEYISVSLFKCHNNIVVRVKNYGVTLSSDIDVFAPFKRSSNSPGTGLGLFLANSAALTLNAKLSIKNQANNRGVVASLVLPIDDEKKK